MFRKNTIQRLFGIDQPVLQAPMAGASNPELVGAVSNAGGLGGLGAAGYSPDQLRSTIHAIRQRTDKPFNVNLFNSTTEQFDRSAVPSVGLSQLLASYHAEFGLGDLPQPRPLFGPMEEQLDVLIEEGVPVISIHFGVDPGDVDRIHARGLKVISSATTVAEARLLELAGVDAVIAQGSEAGGHRGTFDAEWRDSLIGTLALVPQIVDAINLPVIAAGGIMDARGLVACAALGASAVQMGTAFLACPENDIALPYKDALLQADPSATTVTEAMSGKPARGIRNRYITEVETLKENLLPYPLQYSISGPLRRETGAQGSTEFMAMWSGQGVGMLEVQPAATLIDKWIDEAHQLLGELG